MPLLQVGDVNWLTAPSAIDWANNYNPRAVRQELSAVVTMLCQIQEDGALVCPESAVKPAERVEFVDMVGVLENYARAAPTLPDGSTSAGRWVVASFSFRPG